MTVLQGFHRGELAIQEKLAIADAVANNYTWIEPEMPDQHRAFHMTRPPFLPVTTLDREGRPWTSVLAGSTGQPGFISCPSPSRYDMDVKVWEGDPFRENMKKFADGETTLIAGLGIDFTTRRRFKIAGHVRKMRQDGERYRMSLSVEQALGLCPKYINVREFEAHPETFPVVVHQCPQLPENARLPDELVDFIRASDTMFVGTSYQARPEESAKFPSHLGQNQRGGRKGWVRVRSDGKTIVIPDYSGNRLMSSLGNIETTHVAGVTIVDFVTGDILYLTANARTVLGQEAQDIMPRQNILTLVEVTGYTFIRDALPVRQRTGTSPTRSPYSPPVRLLAEEEAAGSKHLGDDSLVTLTRVQIHSDDLATFTWESSQPIPIQPGQTAVLDFSDVVGKAQYQTMNPSNPSSLNDDRVRTWTVSSAHLAPEGTTTFDLTMREQPNGFITGVLFTLARRLAEARPDFLEDTRPLGLAVKLVGIAGSFVLPPAPAPGAPYARMLWLAGGIGVTPFLSMLAALARSHAQADVVLALATREPAVLMPLLAAALEGGAPGLRVALHFFTNETVPPFSAGVGPAVDVTVHRGRIDGAFLAGVEDIAERKAYLCGPQAFEQAMVKVLGERGVTDVVRESFEY
ncbi:hypothetical protein PsYK624_160700 [Phanerochaete sordida]|uniref:FAD-binding FR-type domain-containing protein n=1 Tax=Phanerochaete sordida TaxID=48140 RepID=A0A9P3GV05_9APHY|nr:hypothetical protein PsYK624_160700 [Phanerochaete sordida]